MKSFYFAVYCTGPVSLGHLVVSEPLGRPGRTLVKSPRLVAVAAPQGAPARVGVERGKTLLLSPQRRHPRVVISFSFLQHDTATDAGHEARNKCHLYRARKRVARWGKRRLQRVVQSSNSNIPI